MQALISTPTYSLQRRPLAISTKTFCLRIVRSTPLL